MKFLANQADELCGEIYGIIFQHVKELPPGGASEMVEIGLFDDFDYSTSIICSL